MSIAENLTLAVKRGNARGFGWALPKNSIDEFKKRIKTLNMGLEERLESPIGNFQEVKDKHLLS